MARPVSSARDAHADAVAHLARAVRMAPHDETARDRLVETLCRRSFPQPDGAPLTLAGPGQDLLFLPEDDLLATLSTDGSLELWDLPTRSRRALVRLEHTEAPLSGSLHSDPSGRHLAIQTADSSLHLLQTDPLQPVRRVDDIALARLAAGNRLVVVDADRSEVRCLALESGSVSWKRRLPGIRSLAVSATGAQVAIGQSSGEITLFETDTGRVSASGHLLSASAEGLALSPTGRLVATARAEGTARVWEPATGVTSIIPSAHPIPIGSLSFTPDGRGLVTTWGPWLHLWNSRRGFAMGEGYRNPRPVATVAPAPAALLAATTDGTDTVRVVDLSKGALAMAPIRHPEAVQAVAFHPVDGALLATASRDGVVRFWDVRHRALWPPRTENPLLPAGPHATAPLPPWFPEFAERFVARRVGQEGDVSPLPHLPTENLRALIGPGDDDLVALALWLVSPLDERPAFPGSPLTLPDQLAQNATAPGVDESALRNALRAAPRHGTLLLTLAETIIAEDLALQATRRHAARFHARSAARLDPTLAARSERFLLFLDTLHGLDPKLLAFLRSQRIPFLPLQDLTAPQLLLLPHYNAGLDFSWHDDTTDPNNSFVGLPRGLVTLGGVRFDVRGVIQLNGRNLAQHSEQDWPESVAIPTHRRCRHLHFLHAAAWIPAAPESNPEIGSYEVRFADGSTETIPIRYGREVWGWFLRGDQRDKVEGRLPRDPAEPVPAWHAPRPDERNPSAPLRTLYLTSWKNPRPDITIHEIVFRSAMTDAAPFLLAITGN